MLRHPPLTAYLPYVSLEEKPERARCVARYWLLSTEADTLLISGFPAFRQPATGINQRAARCTHNATRDNSSAASAAAQSFGGARSCSNTPSAYFASLHS